TGLLLAAVGVVAAGVQGGLIRPLAKRVAEVPVILAGVFFQIVAFAGIAWSPSWGRSALYASCACLALGNGLTQPTVGAFISKRADASAQGNTLGTNQSLASLARTIGPALGGWLYGSFGPRSPYTTAAIGMGFALAVTFALDRTNAPARR